MRILLFISILIGFNQICGAQPPKDLNRHGSWGIVHEFNEDGDLIIYNNVYRWLNDNSTDPDTRRLTDSIFEGIPKRFDLINQDMEEFYRKVPFFAEVYTTEKGSAPFDLEYIEAYLRKNAHRINETDMEELLNDLRNLYEEYMRYLQRQ